MTKERTLLWKVFFRSFFFPALWTVQRGQNLGFVFSVWPFIEDLWESAEDRAQTAMGYTGFFSTHPYTSGVVLGVVAGLETDRRKGFGIGPSSETILNARTAMSGPLAAMGEAFFWSTWRPFCLTVAVALTWLAGLKPVAAALAFALLLNSFHLVARWKGLVMGFAHRTDVVSVLASLSLQRVLKFLTILGIVTVIGAAAAANWSGLLSTAVLAAAGFFLVLLRMGISVPVLFTGSFLGAIGYTFYGVLP